MKWQDKRPRKHGYYWMLRSDGDSEVVEVSYGWTCGMYGMYKKPGIRVFEFAEEYSSPLKDKMFDDCQWYGPMEAPA